LTANLELDAAVGQVSYPAYYIETLGDLTNRPPEADALHIAFVKNLKRDHARSRSS
jgi:hypothetical protein